MIHVVDTHALVWYLEGHTNLGETACGVLRDPASQLVIPSIVLAEVRYLHARLRIDVGVAHVLESISALPNFTVYPLDEAVIEHLPTELNIHDGIIVATALVYRDLFGEDVGVITKDQEIVESGLVNTVWASEGV
jgi:PIN domain nuclease of toxin-antitoxin system